MAGANEEGYHLRNANLGRDYVPDVVADIAAARDGDPCAVCGAGLRTARGVEMGNIFKLGTRYSAAVGATFLGPGGQPRPVVMGSYGIGVGRLLACAAEEHHDPAGLRLPASIAPAHVHLCALAGGDPRVTAAGDDRYKQLTAQGAEVLYDDRGERPGVQFADADLIGLPVRVTLSPRSLDRGGAEVKRRDQDQLAVVPLDQVAAEVAGVIGGLLDGLAGALTGGDGLG